MELQKQVKKDARKVLGGKLANKHGPNMFVYAAGAYLGLKFMNIFLTHLKLEMG